MFKNTFWGEQISKAQGARPSRCARASGRPSAVGWCGMSKRQTRGTESLGETRVGPKEVTEGVTKKRQKEPRRRQREPQRRDKRSHYERQREPQRRDKRSHKEETNCITRETE